MHRFLNLVLVASLVTTAACSDSTGPDGPDGPDLSGVWTGSFANASLRMSLSQSGTRVTGTLSVGTTGARNYDVTGTVDAEGTFEWTTDRFDLDCSVYLSSGMQLQNSASMLAGRMTQVSEPPPCGEGRRQVRQGSSTLTRAF